MTRLVLIAAVLLSPAVGAEAPDRRDQLLARLKSQDIEERLEALAGLEEHAPGTVDSKALLRRWAVDAWGRDFEAVVAALAERGDTSLLPALRDLMQRQGWLTERGVRLFLKHGTPSDARFLLDTARNRIQAPKSWRYDRTCSRIWEGARRSKSPLRVPILVALLHDRRVPGAETWRGSHGRAHDAMDELIRATGHDEGFRRSGEPAARDAAIDRWLAWWQREGKAAYARKHPDMLALEAAPQPRPKGKVKVDPRSLPPMVRVADPGRDVSLSYDVPRADVAALLRAGKATATRGAQGELALSFVSREAGLAWFARAAPVLPPRRAAGRRPFVPLCDSGSLGEPAIGPDGRVWFGLGEEEEKEVVPEAVREQIAEKWRDEMPLIRGAGLIGFDADGTLWFRRLRRGSPAYGCGPKRDWGVREGKRRSEAGLPVNQAGQPNEKEDYRGAFDAAGSFVDRKGRFYLPDSHGIHVLSGRTWSYQPLFARNYKENKWLSAERRRFSPLHVLEGPQGNVFVWARWNDLLEETTGTVGYWVFDGRKWSNVDTEERVVHIIPRGREGTCLIVTPPKHDQGNLTEAARSADLVLLKGGRKLAGAAAQEAVCPNLRSRHVSVVASGKDGTAYLLLERATSLRPFRKLGRRVVALPPSGPANDLGERAAEFVRRADREIEAPELLVGPKGWLWATDGRVVEAMSPDGKRFRTLWHTRRLSSIRLLAADGKGRLYAAGSGKLWRIDPDAAEDTQVITDPLLPTMRVRGPKKAVLDTRGRMWGLWYRQAPRVAMFDGTRWTAFSDRDMGTTWRSSGQMQGVVRGANGAMVFTDSAHRLYLHDGQGWANADSVAGLAKRCRERLHKALTGAPGGEDYHFCLHRDAKGRIWWANWACGWGVVDGERALSGPKAGIMRRKGVMGYVTLFAPIGDGSKVVLGNRGGPRVVVTVEKGRLIRVGAPPLAPKRDPDSHWSPWIIRDRAKRVWVATDDRSEAIGPGGTRVASVPAALALADSRGRLWFAREVGDAMRLVCLQPDGRQAETRIPLKYGRLPLAEAPDGTVWLATGWSLRRLRADEARIAVVEEFPAPKARAVWCDRQGRVWLRFFDGHTLWLVRYATTAQAPAKPVPIGIP